jgi:aminoglycoside phosphotransferase (APT) family kinase protein
VSDPAPDIQMPRTTTRSPAKTGERLQRWMNDRLGPAADARISNVDVPATNGLSSETVLFDATWNEEGAERSEALVARVAPEDTAVPVFPVYDLERQFRVMQLVGELSSVPVPKVYWSEPDARPLGTPFFVMGRVDGEVPPDIMPYTFDSWLYAGSPDDQRRLQDATVGVLAELHGIDRAEERFGFLEVGSEGSALRRHVDDQWSYYEWVTADGLRSPLIERCFEWLRANWPADESPTTLSWGDSRIGNILYRDFAPVAVLDWEMAGLAPPEVDIGWLISLHRFFDDIATQYGFPGMPTFLRRDDVCATYEKLTGHAPRDLDWFTMYAATRHGIIMFRIHRRAMHFGEAEATEDVDDMIAHRAMLEAMLAGMYWQDRA